MDTIFMNTENSKTNEPYKFVVNLQRRLGLNKTFQNYPFITRGRI